MQHDFSLKQRNGTPSVVLRGALFFSKFLNKAVRHTPLIYPKNSQILSLHCHCRIFEPFCVKHELLVTDIVLAFKVILSRKTYPTVILRIKLTSISTNTLAKFYTVNICRQFKVTIFVFDAKIAKRFFLPNW